MIFESRTACRGPDRVDFEEEDLRDRVTRAMADGLPKRVIAWEQADRDAFREDPYLLLQFGIALGMLDRLADAERAFTAARDHLASSDDQKAFADRQLEWIASEWARLDDVSSARGRAFAVGALGLVGTAACITGLFVVARRMRVEDDATTDKA
ncbi:MAG: hypothetical protein H6833_00105 [Planctomycetes bacterium]|nr:hypothetical protein [Planctomycetota bacterium]